MADDSLILEHLRTIRADLADTRSDIREIKNRLTNLESGQANILVQLGHLAGSDAEQHARYDRLVERIERIERRLELSD